MTHPRTRSISRRVVSFNKQYLFIVLSLVTYRHFSPPIAISRHISPFLATYRYFSLPIAISHHLSQFLSLSRPSYTSRHYMFLLIIFTLSSHISPQLVANYRHFFQLSSTSRNFSFYIQHYVTLYLYTHIHSDMSRVCM